jgi:ADP-heptose:LPS heptosyltransferase
VLKRPKNILIIRFSAMGDVVLTVPVILSLLKEYPDTQITLLTKPFFHPFFKEIPNLTLFPVDLKNKHKGVKGLYNLVRELTHTKKFDAVIDLHSVIRTWLIDTFFKLKGIPVYRIDKGRKEKQAFVKQKNGKKLPHSTERYRNVFVKSGFDFTLTKALLPVDNKKLKDICKEFVVDKAAIGIAPFAAHKSKQWGIDKVTALIEQINKKNKVRFYLFGGGADEVKQLNMIAGKYKNVINLAGRFSLADELHLLQELDVLIAMDSGNMHIASLLGTPVISIWGGTHPDLGFSALYQPEKNTIQIDIANLPCRPCSVFGTNTCQLTDKPFACMTQMGTSAVIHRLEEMKIV